MTGGPVKFSHDASHFRRWLARHHDRHTELWVGFRTRSRRLAQLIDLSAQGLRLGVLAEQAGAVALPTSGPGKRPASPRAAAASGGGRPKRSDPRKTGERATRPSRAGSRARR